MAQSSPFSNRAALNKLLAVGQSLSDVRQLKKLLQKITTLACSVLGADVVVLYEYRADIDDVKVPPVFWGDIRQPEVLRVSGGARPHRESAVFQMLKRSRPVYAVDAAQRWRQPGLAAGGSFVEREAIVSSAAVRLTASDQRVGVLFINYRVRHTFTVEEQHAIELFASQAAAAIQYARLVDQERQLRRQADTLRDIAVTISAAGDLPTTAAKILDAMHRVVKYRKATMQLIQDDTRTLLAYRGFDAQKIDAYLLRPVSQDALITRVVKSQKPVILSKTDRAQNWEKRPYTANVRSWVGLPLVYGGQTIGLITLDHDRAGAYSPALARVLTPFALQAAIAIKNAQLFGEAQDRIRDLQLLNDVSQIMTVKLSTDDLLNAICEQIVEKLGCAHCTIFSPVVDSDQTRLVAQAIQGEHRDQILRRSFELGQGLVGWAFVHGRSMVLPDARLDPRFTQASRNADRPRSMLIVPVTVGDKTIGVISADQDEYGWFSANDLSLVEALARQAGIAMQRNSGLELVREIGDQINAAQQIDEILQHIVSGAIKLTNATSGVIYLIDEEDPSHIKSYKYPPTSFHPPPRLERADSSTRRVMNTGALLVFPDVRQDVSVHPTLRAQIRSMIAVPLKREGRVIGVLYLNDENPHDFTEAERSLLLTLANQAATAIYKAQLLSDWQQQVTRHQALSAVITQLTGTLEENEILQAVARLAFEPLDCTQCSVFRVESNGIVVRASQGSLEHQLQLGRTFRLGQGVAGWVAKFGRPALVIDTADDERFDPTWSSQSLQSMVVVPILLDEEVYGVISIEHTRQGAFTQDDQQLLETLARQASQALRGARRIHELQVLYQAGQLFASQLDRMKLFESLLDTVNTTFNCLFSTLFLVDPVSGDLWAAVRRGAGYEDIAELRFHVGESLVGQVAQQQASLIVPDVDRDPQALLSRSIPRGHPHSMLLTPLLLPGPQLIGVITADRDIIDGFDDDDRRLLETLCSQAAVALDNARLFREQKQLADELALLHEVSAGWITLDQDRLLRLIVDGALRLTGTTHGIIYLLDEEGKRIERWVSVPADFTGAELELSSGGLFRQIYETGEPIVVTETYAEPRVSSIVEQYGIRSFIGQPLKVDEGVIGVFYLNSTIQREFNAAERKLIATLAAQAAKALETARLYAKLSRQIDGLHLVVQEASTVRVLERVLDGIHQLLGESTSSSINLYHVETGQFHGSYQAAGELKEYLQGVPPRARGTSSYVLSTGLPLYLDDVRDPPPGLPTIRSESIERGVISFAALPLRWQARVVGMLFINLRKHMHFSDEIKRVLELYVSQAVIALVSARLYEDLQRRARYLSSLNQISRQAKELLDLRQLFEGVVREARATLNADRCTLFILNNEGVLVPQALEGVDQAARLTYPIGEGLAGWVAQEGHSERVPDAQRDPRFIADATVQTDRPRAMVLAPLWVEGKVAGVLSVDRENDTPFDEDDQLFVETLAVQTGILWQQKALRVQRMDGFKRQRNPYVVGEPIRNSEGFFGRQPLIQEIMDGIHQNNFILYGERRIGKTSVLFQIERRLNEVSRQPDKYFFLPILASLQGISEPGFFDFLIDRMALATGQPRGSNHGSFGLEDLLKRVVPELQAGHPERKVRLVLLLDEMDQFTQYSSTTHELFRGVAQTRVGEHLKMIMTGVSIHRVAQLRTSPWYNLFEGIELPELDEVDGQQLVIEPVRGYYHYAPDALHLLLDRTDYKPCEIQRLGWHSVNRMLARLRAAGQVLDDSLTAMLDIVVEDVSAATTLVLAEKDGEYRELWSQFHAAQQAALREAQLSNGQLRMALVGVSDKARFTPEQLYNITRHSGGQWRLTYLFDTWLRGLNT
jgi:GAF domain-containing protein